MKKHLFLYLFLVLILCSVNTSLSAQTGRGKVLIRGRVLDDSGGPVANAIVTIDGRNTSYITDAEGNYRIRVKRTASTIGIFTFDMGYMEEGIGGRTLINFRFSSLSAHVLRSYGEMHGDEVVDMGYSSVRRRDVTNSVGVFDFKNPKKVYTSVDDMIKEIPGINSKVFNMYGPVGPMIVVNGIPNADISTLLPSMVESIVFLRDASAAIYGSMAFGGVILIKTKTTTIDK